MPQAKAHAHRRGHGNTGVHRLTTLRAGPLGDNGAGAAADTFVDVYPYVSLRGMNADRSYDRRGNVMAAHDESKIQKRTGGKHRGRIVSAE